MHCALRLVLLAALLSTASLASAEPLGTEHGHVSAQVPEQELLEANSHEDTRTSDSTGCSDYTTSNGSEWHDSGGEEYDCQWYSYNISQTGDSYGDHHCESYGDSYEYDGYTADEACCTCGGGTGTTESPTEAPSSAPSVGDTSHPTYAPSEVDTPAPTEAPSHTSSSCEDNKGSGGTTWHDSQGESYNCDWYSEGDNCETYGDQYENDGYTANQACCACQSTGEPTVAPTEGPTDAPTVGETDEPTEAPTVGQTDAPTRLPSEEPTVSPTDAPTEIETMFPTEEPTVGVTKHPTYAPTGADTPAPTEAPTEAAPTEAPTVATTECEDKTGSDGTTWHDSEGDSYNCDWYCEGDNCETYGDQYENDGYTANQACCACQ